MSKISTIIDGLATFLTTQYPAPAQEHVNPYTLELNDEFSLTDGWSFFIGPVVNTQEMASKMLSLERDIVINRTLKNFGTKEDVSIRRGVEKALLEAGYQLILEVERDPVLEPLLELITFIGDNGVEVIQGEETQFLALRSTFTIKYYEQL